MRPTSRSAAVRLAATGFSALLIATIALVTGSAPASAADAAHDSDCATRPDSVPAEWSCVLLDEPSGSNQALEGETWFYRDADNDLHVWPFALADIDELQVCVRDTTPFNPGGGDAAEKCVGNSPDRVVVLADDAVGENAHVTVDLDPLGITPAEPAYWVIHVNQNQKTTTSNGTATSPEPSPSPSPSESVSPSPSPSESVSPSPSPSESVSPSPSESVSPSQSVQPAPSESVSASPSETASVSPTELTASPSVSATVRGVRSNRPAPSVAGTNLPRTGNSLPLGPTLGFALALLAAGVIGQVGASFVPAPYVGKHSARR